MTTFNVTVMQCNVPTGMKWLEFMSADFTEFNKFTERVMKKNIPEDDPISSLLYDSYEKNVQFFDSKGKKVKAIHELMEKQSRKMPFTYAECMDAFAGFENVFDFETYKGFNWVNNAQEFLRTLKKNPEFPWLKMFGDIHMLKEKYHVDSQFVKVDPPAEFYSTLTIMCLYLRIFNTIACALTCDKTHKFPFMQETVMHEYNDVVLDVGREVYKDQDVVTEEMLMDFLHRIVEGIQNRIDSASSNLQADLQREFTAAVRHIKPDFICMQEGQHLKVKGYRRYFDTSKSDCSIYAKSGWKLNESTATVVGGLTPEFPLFNVNGVLKGNYFSAGFTHKTHGDMRVVSMHLPSTGNSKGDVFEQADDVLQQLTALSVDENIVCGMDCNTKTPFHVVPNTLFGSEDMQDQNDLTDHGTGMTFFDSCGATTNKTRSYLQFQYSKAGDRDNQCKDLIGYHYNNRTQQKSFARYRANQDEYPFMAPLDVLPSPHHKSDHAWVFGTVQFTAAHRPRAPRAPRFRMPWSEADPDLDVLKF